MTWLAMGVVAAYFVLLGLGCWVFERISRNKKPRT
jgi:hypothetical protein